MAATATTPNYRKTYWSHHGKHEAIKDKLEKLIPDEGEVPNADKNPILEKFRKAANCYYDLYNNGLCNRQAEFEDVFGITLARDEDDKLLDSYRLTQQLVNETEAAINRIILAAAKEQGIR